MATREENLKKINDELEKLSDDELEKLTDEELDDVAGGVAWIYKSSDYGSEKACK